MKNDKNNIKIDEILDEKSQLCSKINKMEKDILDVANPQLKEFLSNVHDASFFDLAEYLNMVIKDNLHNLKIGDVLDLNKINNLDSHELDELKLTYNALDTTDYSTAIKHTFQIIVNEKTNVIEEFEYYSYVL